MKISQVRADDRLCALEAKLESLEARVSQLEAAPFPRPTWEQAEDSSAEMAPLHAEYWIGARLLPRMGAVLIILAIAYLAISEFSKSASVDRWVLLLIEALFCLGFIGVGDWRRDELEGFGRTLTAIGSCGLYLTAAGGHFAYHTLSASGMASGFAVLSLLNHGYAIWRNSRLFFFLGASGGLAAMLFALSAKDYATGTAVYAVVTLAAAAVCAVRRWRALAMLGWFSGLAILVPVIDSDFPRLWIVAALYVGSLACFAAVAKAYTVANRLSTSVGVVVATAGTMVMAFIVLPGPLAALHLAVFAAAVLVVRQAMRPDNRAADAMAIGAIAAAATLIPIGFDAFTATLAYVGLVLAAAAVQRWRWRSLTAAFAVCGLFAAAVSYSVWAVQNADARDYGLLTALAIGAAATCWSLNTARWAWVSLAVASGWLLIDRTAVVLSRDGVSSRAFSLLTLVSIAYAVGLLGAGFRFRSGELRLWSIAVMLAAVTQILTVETGTSIGFRLAALLFLGGLMLAGGYRYVRDRQLQSEL